MEDFKRESSQTESEALVFFPEGEKKQSKKCFRFLFPAGCHILSLRFFFLVIAEANGYH